MFSLLLKVTSKYSVSLIFILEQVSFISCPLITSDTLYIPSFKLLNSTVTFPSSPVVPSFCSMNCSVPFFLYNLNLTVSFFTGELLLYL